MPISGGVLVGVVLGIGGVVGLGVGYAAWQHDDHPAAAPLAKTSALPGVSSLAFGALLLFPDPPISRVLFALAHVCLFLAPAYFLLFTVAYTGRDRWLRGGRKRALIGLYVVASLAMVIEPLVLAEVTVRTVNGVTLPVLGTNRVRLLATLLFVYPATLGGLALLGAFFVSPRNMYRTQTGVIILAVLFTVVGNVVFEAGFSPHPGLNLTSVFFGVEAIIIALALFRFDFFRVKPLAPGVVLEEIDDPVIVLDETESVVDLNPSGRLLVAVADPIGTPVERAFPGLLTAAAKDERYVPGDADLSSDGGEIEVYDINDAPITDQYERNRGTVIVLRDVTLQQRRERTFASLQSVSQQFLTAETRQEVLDIAATTAYELLGYPYSGAMVYDESEDVLRPASFADPLTAAYEDSEYDGDPVIEPGEDDIWQVFVSGEAMVGSPIQAGGGDEIPVDIGGSLIYPLGDHGILGVSAGPDHDGFSEDDRRFVDILATTTENALDRVEKEQQLRESRELLTKRTEQIEFFNSVLRHDLLNGMLVIQGHTEELKDLVDGEAADHVEIIDSWSEDITSLASKVRSVTKTLTGEEPVELTAVDLGTAIEAKVDKLRNGHETVSVDVRTDTLPPVRADDLLPAVVENILSNAIEHNDTDHPEITVETTVGEETVTVRIADNGPGIPDEMKDAVFDEQVTSEASGSVGFGLYFVRVMVDRYGGDVWFEDREAMDDAVDTGAVAVLELPVAGEA
jgi:signal transduction histidine kinase